MRPRFRHGLLALCCLLASCSDQVVDPDPGSPTVSPPAFTIVGNVTDISTGSHHTCAIAEGGEISCWGNDNTGLDDYIEGRRDREQEVNCSGSWSCRVPQPSGSFTQLSAGRFHTCGLRVDRAIVCWGYNVHGQTDAPSGTFTQVSAGEYHTCAVGTDGGVRCWGLDEDGQLDAPSGSFTQVEAGYFHSCAIDTGGAIRCWGPAWATNAPGGSFTQVSVGAAYTCGLRTDGTIGCAGSNDYGQTNAPAGSFAHISSGKDHSCAVGLDAALICWGGIPWANYGQPPSGRFTRVTAELFHACGIRADGSPECWGDDGSAAVTIMEGSFTQVSTNEFYNCAVRPDGTIECWAGFWREIFPPDIDTNSDYDFTQVSIANSGACAIDADHALTCWGDNRQGMPEGSFTRVSLGMFHSCALATEGEIHCWGYNGSGQTDVPSGRFTDLSAGFEHTCGIRTDGSLSCWGGYGQPPILTFEVAGSFTQVSTGYGGACAISTAATISCFGVYGHPIDAPSGTFTQVSGACAIRTDATLTCWDQPPGSTNIPTGSFTYVSAGGNHTCAIRTDTTLECWGAPATTTYVPLPNEAVRLSAITLPGALQLGSAAAISAPFSDRNLADAHTATIEWGDGTTTAGVVTEAKGTGTVHGSHTYAQPGIYTVRLTISDGALESSRASSSDAPGAIIVYDTNAGFVTGSGWFDTSADACSGSACAGSNSPTGKAKFELTAKYETGADTPTGTSAFQFSAIGVTFESSNYDCLVVTPDRTLLGGNGTIDGSGDYAFLLSVVDGEASDGGGVDRVRIRIWERSTGEVVYDNQPGAPDDAAPATEIGGGNIVLHTATK